MQDVLGQVGALERPRLLIRAARFGLQDYHREPHLRRLLRTDILPRPGEAIMKLLEIEAVLEDLRLSGGATYRFVRHIDVLIALMAETRLLRAATRPRSMAPDPDPAHMKLSATADFFAAT